MSEQNDLSYMANLYMALADQTRLRLLLKMYAGEVCVGDFTDALGDSQPKISRHLAYLRNAGIVSTRRDGKWIHYSICWPDEAGGRAMLHAALEWLATGETPLLTHQPQATVDRGGSLEQLQQENACAEADMNETESRYESAHNELEEFLL